MDLLPKPMELELDDAVVHAALEFIDTFDAQAPVAKPNNQPLRKRQRDMLALRKEFHQLQTKLQRLQRAHVEIPLSRTVTPWQAVASAQRQRRTRAEIKNKELRALLSINAQNATRLQRLLHSDCWHQANNPRPVAQPEKQRPLPSPPIFTGSSLLTTAILQDMVSRIGVIFGSAQFLSKAQTGEPHYDVVTRKNAKDVYTVELFDSRAVPFHPQTLSDAIWRHIRHQQPPGETLAAHDKITSNTFLEREQIVRWSPRSPEDQNDVFHNKSASHRFASGSTQFVVQVNEILVRFGEETVFSTTEQHWTIVHPRVTDSVTSPVIATAQTYQISVPSTRQSATHVNKSDISLNAYVDCMYGRMQEYWDSVESLVLTKSSFN